ncbi:MAG TPA: epoxide hydrolase, partial [Streptosporangiaceae bacterium]
MTEIDGLDIHFIHVRSNHENALPLIVTHGWPGSVIELLKVIDPLTNPTAHGGSASDAFHLVIPSMPGYGFSGKPRDTGWDPARMARAWVVLMKRLGYTQFVAQGGDWGCDCHGCDGCTGTSGIARHALQHAWCCSTRRCRGAPVRRSAAIRSLSRRKTRVRAAERRVYEGIGYAVEMGTQPQTLYGLADSPVGLAAWMINHDAYSYGQISHAFVDGHPAGELTRDEILDNITLYWLTNTGIS